jgi:hypothetical protein
VPRWVGFGARISTEAKLNIGNRRALVHRGPHGHLAARSGSCPTASLLGSVNPEVALRGSRAGGSRSCRLVHGLRWATLSCVGIPPSQTPCEVVESS